jgi:hypothetical protein
LHNQQQPPFCAACGPDDWCADLKNTCNLATQIQGGKTSTSRERMTYKNLFKNSKYFGFNQGRNFFQNVPPGPDPFSHPQGG